MKKILIIAYLKKNLGDDIFVDEILKRYPDVQFYINVTQKEFGESFINRKNLIIQKVEKEDFEQIDIEKYDGYVYIGGSIFMEGGKVYNLDEGCYKFIKTCKEMGKPFFYISSNYGPFKTQKYFNLCKKTFETCTDLCFRDKYSYELFEELNTVRYAPDAALAMKVGKINTIKDTLGISLIDLEIREKIKDKEFEYINFINNNIDEYIRFGKKVYLFTFCKHEGDENMAEKICKSRKNDINNGNVIVVKYEKDVQEFLEIYKRMEYMICGRFHSLILSYLFEQKFYVISYSKKINNIIEEFNLCDKYIEFSNIDEKRLISFEEFYDVDTEKLDYLKREAQRQFEKLDEFLK